ncbi:MAG: hypothetical protein R3B36_26195 [Polyangiaceae bacterium]
MCPRSLKGSVSKARLARMMWMSVLVALLGVTAVACAAPVEGEEETSASSADELRCTNAKAVRLASIANRMNGKRSRRLCYRYVKAHLRGAGFSTSDVERRGYGGSAYKFASWAKAYPSELARMGLQKVNLSLNELPKGAVIVWPRGMCGYHRTHGHIEVVVDDNSSRACSDFCGRIKKGCGQPDIFIPKGCVASAPTEDDDDTSVPAGASDDDDDDATPGSDDATPGSDDGADTTATDAPAADDGEVGSCWSPTMDKQMDGLSCVQSRSNGIWFQCKDGLWYRGVSGRTGPFAPCASVHPL